MAMQVGRVMNHFPVITDKRMPIQDAATFMEDKDIRHLPVVENGKIVGIISDRDIKQFEPFADSMDILVVDAMTANPYTAQASTPLSEVVYNMARKKYGCAIITNADHEIRGIFTTTDAMYMLSRLLQEPEPVKARKPFLGAVGDFIDEAKVFAAGMNAG